MKPQREHYGQIGLLVSCAGITAAPRQSRPIDRSLPRKASLVNNKGLLGSLFPATLAPRRNREGNRVYGKDLNSLHFLACCTCTPGGPKFGGTSPVREFRNASRSLRSCPLRKSSTWISLSRLGLELPAPM